MGALTCFGVVDAGSSFRRDPDPVSFVVVPTCGRHRQAVADWCREAWGELGDGLWVPAAAIPVLIDEMEATERVVLAPTLAECVRVRVRLTG